MRAILGFIVAALLVPAAGAGLGTDADAHVHIESFAFNPSPVNILVGEAITWDNHDTPPHTVTADDGSFDSGNINNGGTYTRTFSAPGTIPYHCDLHPTMLGTIVVSDPNAKPDLVISGMAFTDAVPAVQKRVDVTVRNLGDASAPASTALVEYVYQGARVVIGEASVPAVGPGATQTVSVSWNTLGKVGDFDVRATADSGGDVVEADEGNNEGRATASIILGGIASVPGIDLLDPL